MSRRRASRLRGAATGSGASPAPLYRGSTKHKNRPADEQKGTLCPEWTHDTTCGGFATDPFAHDWPQTLAQRLLADAAVHASGRRFATHGGVAFEAKPSRDGTWHGFPIPWETVPPDIKDQWIDGRLVKRRQMRLVGPEHRGDIGWALKIGPP